MKKYRLKKDLPTVRAGEVFVRKTNETMQTDMIYHVDSEDVFLPPSIEVDDIHNFDEWFEEVKEFEEWKPKKDEGYKLLYANGNVMPMTFDGGEIDQHYLSIGNCYPLDTPDGVIIKEQRLIPQAMHRLRMAAKKAWFEFNGSEGPDWSDSRQKKFSIKRWHVTGAYLANYASNEEYLGGVYFPTSDSAHYYINNNEDDIELLFGVER